MCPKARSFYPAIFFLVIQTNSLPVWASATYSVDPVHSTVIFCVKYLDVSNFA